MARPRQPKGPTQVTAYDHDETRSNIPTADAAATFYDENKDSLPPLRYPRNPDLDPQLVWKGKDAQDGEDLVVDAPPIYIQEKIAPQALIQNLRKRSQSAAEPAEATLFDFEDFDTLDDLSQVEFYQHEESWKNRMILGDSLQVMASLAEREALRGKVQMIYIDPPYGIKFGSNWQVRASKRDVRDGRLDDAAREAEQIRAFRDTWELGIHSYLSYLRDRLIVARDLLTESGSVFVQIGDENVHLVRSLLDEVFGAENFVSQVIFRKTTGKGGELLDNTYDVILWFSKDKTQVKYRQVYVPRDYIDDPNIRFLEQADGLRRSMSKDESSGRAPLPPDARAYRALRS
ncbi:site-specific DNA-methyltransferase [Microbacterium sp. SCN 69-37]|uniref:DNA methyltransferase n=1 Tax=Microbacterium sp. SCN 69-37 TaxID=1660115 RepID=UPI000B188360|nr:site-specific DNA-methyltransferase [Microbacterium sp. SCN 69-37]